MQIKEVIVVEGRSDTVAVKRAVEADTIETNGSAIGEAVLRQVELAHARRGVIVFTDPDFQGNRIRRIVSERVPGCKHAFISKEHANKPGRSLGVEHAGKEAIQEALLSVRTEIKSDDMHYPDITMSDLLQAGLISGAHARERREQIGERLAIGYANGKQLLKRLHLFRITEKEFGDALKWLEKTEEQRCD